MDQHALQLADVLTCSLPRDQLPGQRMKLCSGRAQRQNDAPLLFDRLQDRYCSWSRRNAYGSPPCSAHANSKIRDRTLASAVTIS